jgi:hypothetical protein
MKSKIFDINDIIVIISKMIEDRKNEELYGIEDDILDFLGDTKFASFFSPFKAYCENEINEYKKYVSKFSN